MTERTILITGCSSGIGLDAARGLRARGWRVFASCRGGADCARLRAEHDVPIVMLSALSADHQRMAGYERGADDYVAKPFNPELLLARIGAHARVDAEALALLRDSGPVAGEAQLRETAERLDQLVQEVVR